MIDKTTTSEGAGDLCGYATRPFAFIFRYVRFRAPCHAMIVAAVLAAVTCSVTTQYGVQYLVCVCIAGRADRGRQFALARRRLDRQFYLRARDQRPAARSVPSSDRSFA